MNKPVLIKTPLVTITKNEKGILFTPTNEICAIFQAAGYNLESTFTPAPPVKKKPKS